jgi:hypothetical protein
MRCGAFRLLELLGNLFCHGSRERVHIAVSELVCRTGDFRQRAMMGTIRRPAQAEQVLLAFDRQESLPRASGCAATIQPKKQRSRRSFAETTAGPGCALGGSPSRGAGAHWRARRVQIWTAATSTSGAGRVQRARAEFWRPASYFGVSQARGSPGTKQQPRSMDIAATVVVLHLGIGS